METKFILTLLKPYNKIVVLLLLLSCISSAFEGVSIGMLVPLLGSLQNMQDYSQLPRFLQMVAKLFVDLPPESQVIYSVITVISAVLIKNIFLALSVYLGYWLTCKVIADIKTQAIDMLMTVGLEFYHKTKTGHLVEKILYNSLQVEHVIKYSTEFFVNFVTLLMLLVLLIVLSWQLTLIAFFFAAGVAFILSRYSRYLASLSENVIESRRELSGTLIENIAGIQVIKNFSKEQAQAQQLKQKIEHFRKNRQRQHAGLYMIHVITEGIGILMIGMLFFIAIKGKTIDSRVVIVQVLPFIYILTRLIPILKHLNHAKGVIVSSWPYVQLVEDLLRYENKPIIPDGHENYRGLKNGIHFKSVNFVYSQNKKLILHNADFFIPKGKTTAIVGESGAGKSTIINVLLRFYDVQDGTILIDETPLQNFQIASFRRTIGVVSQDTFVFNDTVSHNIAFGAQGKLTDDAIMEAARKAGAHDFIMELPQGYDTIVGDRGVMLSGGQRQRVSIARAILKNPEILILDEATSSLDTRTEKLIHDAISDLSRNRTVIIIAHRLSTVKEADQIIVLKKGRVIEVGKEEHLLAQKGEFYRLANAH